MIERKKGKNRPDRLWRAHQSRPWGTQQEYLILADEEKAGFLADRVLGMRTLDRRAFISLREPALNETNRYLEAAVLLPEEQEGEVLAYVLKPEILKERQWKL
ncbi:hypothetical protein LC724_01050 [Blautia sp. RD014234]|nr:hypothetical protein [Blautia parvula]